MRFYTIVIAGLLALGGAALADAPLETALGLNMEQARQVKEIQARYRKQFAVKRGERNTDMRRLRRARFAKDGKAVAELEKLTEAQRLELVRIRASEDAEIRRLLNPEQNKKFDDYIKLRREMVGSSRDEADMKNPN
ncbi:MAG: Spy/CpxP family protein refolding chaperone [Bryobacteraceae bacterium]